MGNIIYLISVLSKVGKISVAIAVFMAAVLFIGIWFYFDDSYLLDESESKSAIRFFMVSGIVLAVSIIIAVMIPSKEEMYMIAFTKDYEVEDVYSMSKEEIKGSIDYVFKKIEELKK